MKKGYLFIPETAEEIKKVEDFWYGRNQEQGQQKIIFVCSNEDCKKEVSQKVKEYSEKNYNKILCMDCQKKEGK